MQSNTDKAKKSNNDINAGIRLRAQLALHYG
jgi:hypothetical protein